MKQRRRSTSGIRIGCAGWTVPPAQAHHFPEGGSHLERYAARFPAVEINSTFYRRHKATTFERWVAAVPPSFRFAIKMSKEITHDRRLDRATDQLERFVHDIAAFGSALGPVLVQLPPSLAYDPRVTEDFFSALRKRFVGQVALEPRHTSWFTSSAERLLTDLRIARVAADPSCVPDGRTPGGWPGLTYYRLHGSPRMYYSSYSAEYLKELARTLRTADNGIETWCVFDNTAFGTATENAIAMLEYVSASFPEPSRGDSPERSVAPATCDKLHDELVTSLQPVLAAPVEEIRNVRRRFSRMLEREDAQTVMGLAYRLLHGSSDVGRFVAYELVANHAVAFASITERELERLGHGIASWGAADTFACYLAGPAWRERQVRDALPYQWAHSADRWWRRAALVSTVALNSKARGGHGDPDRTLRICSVLVRDRDDMVVKALSWALRELSKRDASTVEAFLDRHMSRLAPRVLREVRSKLKTGLKTRTKPRKAGR